MGTWKLQTNCPKNYVSKKRSFYHSLFINQSRTTTSQLITERRPGKIKNIGTGATKDMTEGIATITIAKGSDAGAVTGAMTAAVIEALTEAITEITITAVTEVAGMTSVSIPSTGVPKNAANGNGAIDLMLYRL